MKGNLGIIAKEDAPVAEGPARKRFYPCSCYPEGGQLRKNLLTRHRRDFLPGAHLELTALQYQSSDPRLHLHQQNNQNINLPARPTPAQCSSSKQFSNSFHTPARQPSGVARALQQVLLMLVIRSTVGPHWTNLHFVALRRHLYCGQK